MAANLSKKGAVRVPTETPEELDGILAEVNKLRAEKGFSPAVAKFHKKVIETFDQWKNRAPTFRWCFFLIYMFTFGWVAV